MVPNRVSQYIEPHSMECFARDILPLSTSCQPIASHESNREKERVVCSFGAAEGRRIAED